MLKEENFSLSVIRLEVDENLGLVFFIGHPLVVECHP